MVIMNYEDHIKESFKVKYPADTIFPSEVGICYRKSYLARNIEFERGINEIYLDLGEQYHERIEQYFKEKLNCQTEVEIKDEIEGIKISGRIDIVCNNDLLEIKTISYNYFQVKEYHLYQVALYYHILKKQNYQINNVYIIYLNRNTREVKQFKIDEKVLENYYQKVIEWIKKFKEYLKETDYKKVPGVNNYICKSCEFKQKCIISLF
ncbi:hypothetical protein [Sulfolobus islandicus rudivirus 1 variant XX]|nr:hypothetical protein [Sulfolobus islandicus rudivirus 1 variant XX]